MAQGIISMEDVTIVCDGRCSADYQKNYQFASAATRLWGDTTTSPRDILQYILVETSVWPDDWPLACTGVSPKEVRKPRDVPHIQPSLDDNNVSCEYCGARPVIGPQEGDRRTLETHADSPLVRLVSRIIMWSSVLLAWFSLFTAPPIGHAAGCDG